jgi:hypothetical protein
MSASSSAESTVDAGRFGPFANSATPFRRRHLATVFGLTPYLRARTAVGASLRWNSRRMRAVVRALGWRLADTNFRRSLFE